MDSFSGAETFNFADTWPVGSFRLKAAVGLVDVLFEHFDVPCWPELTGAGPEEELVGFWLPLFQEWESSETEQVIDAALLQRPGIQAMASRLAGNPTEILKGQMIGPVTLQWALKQKEAPVIDRDKILKFTHQAFLSQSFLLKRFARKVIVSLDEPCAFLDPSAHRMWQELFDRFSFEDHFGIALHSCGEVQGSLFGFPWDVVHVDFNELEEALDRDPELAADLKTYCENGGWLALGGLRPSPMAENDVERIAFEINQFLDSTGLLNILVSTSCGMADVDLKSTEEKLFALENLAQELSGGGPE